MQVFNGDIVQIIPAPPNLFNKTADPDGDIYAPIVCIALTDEGGIYFCDTMSDGYIDLLQKGNIYQYDNFSGQYEEYCK